MGVCLLWHGFGGIQASAALLQRLDRCQGLAQIPAGQPEVMADLHPQPEPLAEPKETAETQIRLSGTPRAKASRYWLIPIGRRNSSR